MVMFSVGNINVLTVLLNIINQLNVLETHCIAVTDTTYSLSIILKLKVLKYNLSRLLPSL